LEPGVEMDVKGAVLFKDDCHVDPGSFMRSMKKYLEENGVTFLLNTLVTSIEKKGKSVTAVITNNGRLECDNMILATGSWLPVIAKMLGVKILLQPGKGYSYTYDHVERNIHYPAILVDGRCAMTPWGHRLRIGGTMELSGINENILPRRMEGIYRSVKSFYPGLEITPPPENKIWSGLRPVSPDGLPYIGRISKFDNVVIAGGHAMIGVSLAPGTGKLVTEIIRQEDTSIDMSAFAVERF